MGALVSSNREVARKKGTRAAVTALGGLVLVGTGLWPLAVPVAALGAYLGFDWFMFRARNGMRF